jgi:hypothetical protein
MLKRIILSLVLIAALGATPFAIDIYRDRQHRIAVHGSVTVYQSPEPYWRDHSNLALATVTEQDALSVMRIHYTKDYMVIRVRLGNGQQGYIFYGDSFQLL